MLAKETWHGIPYGKRSSHVIKVPVNYGDDLTTELQSSLGVSWRSKLADGFQVGVNLIGGDLQVGLQ